MGIIKYVDLIALNELLSEISEASIQLRYKNILSKQKIALKRAKIANNKF